ncbi:unnamed protein product, partial [Urochloa humidicola]
WWSPTARRPRPNLARAQRGLEVWGGADSSRVLEGHGEGEARRHGDAGNDDDDQGRRASASANAAAVAAASAGAVPGSPGDKGSDDGEEESEVGTEGRKQQWRGQRRASLLVVSSSCLTPGADSRELKHARRPQKRLRPAAGRARPRPQRGRRHGLLRLPASSAARPSCAQIRVELPWRARRGHPWMVEADRRTSDSFSAACLLLPLALAGRSKRPRASPPPPNPPPARAGEERRRRGAGRSGWRRSGAAAARHGSSPSAAAGSGSSGDGARGRSLRRHIRRRTGRRALLRRRGERQASAGRFGHHPPQRSSALCPSAGDEAGGARGKRHGAEGEEKKIRSS